MLKLVVKRVLRTLPDFGQHILLFVLRLFLFRLFIVSFRIFLLRAPFGAVAKKQVHDLEDFPHCEEVQVVELGSRSLDDRIPRGKLVLKMNILPLELGFFRLVLLFFCFSIVGESNSFLVTRLEGKVSLLIQLENQVLNVKSNLQLIQEFRNELRHFVFSFHLRRNFGHDNFGSKIEQEFEVLGFHRCTTVGLCRCFGILSICSLCHLLFPVGLEHQDVVGIVA
mmetsp:Transcript_29864/g.58353  ORF Transcript_29864/g.58353 Transcript_29864/m.58353 type:complete len:224 (-) Transcript_29864:1637-2308(-)